MELSVTIANVPVAVSVPPGEVADALARTLAPFAAPRSGRAFRLAVELTSAAARPRSASGQRRLPRVERSARTLAIDGGDFDGRLDLATGEGVVRGPAERFGADTALKVLIAELAGQRGAVVVHGVALGAGAPARAALFSGPSGAGKSTLGQFASAGGLRLLSDELVAVAPEPEGWVAYGTPWNLGAPLRAPLALVGTLAFAPAPSHALEPQGAAEVLRTLISNVLLVEDTPGARASLFRRCTDLLSGVRTARLVFSRTASVADVLAEALR